jgi:methyltransferase (TIGR00027 family)
MKDNQSSMTALISSFGRAYHFEHDTPTIFADRVARQLMTDDEYEQIAGYMAGGIDFFAPEKKGEFTDKGEALKWIIQTQISPTPLARAKYCEDMLRNAISIGAEQYVILGAGMDTFAYRNYDIISKIKVFELDHPNTQKFKKLKVEQAGFTISDNLKYVPIDFKEDNLAHELDRAGFNRNKRTFFSWLGVTYYLTKEQILNTLQAISAVSAKGSSIVFDYADEKLFISDVKRVQNMIAMAKASGEPMQSCFSYEELERLLERADFLLYEHLTAENIEERFFAGRNDYLHAFEHINYALAVKK